MMLNSSPSRKLYKKLKFLKKNKTILFWVEVRPNLSFVFMVHSIALTALPVLGMID